VPVEFLNPDQQKSYGRYAGEPTLAQLERYRRRGAHNRLGFALQLCTVRFLGTFLSDPTDVPSSVVAYLAQQLSIEETSCLPRYLEREATRREHAGEIQQLYGYTDFGIQPESWRLLRWLYERTWLSAERPSVLFDLTMARLVERKILLPGVTTLTRLIAQVRERANRRLWRVLSQQLDAQQRKGLEELLIADNARITPFERLKKGPTRLSTPSLAKALLRLQEIRALGVNRVNLSRIPRVRLQLLARTAATARAQAIARMPAERRIATLLAWAHEWEAEATDDVIDLLDALIRELSVFSVREGRKERLRTLKDLDKAALQLSEACQVLFDPDTADPDVRGKIFERFDPIELMASMTAVERLARPEDDEPYCEFMLKRWRSVRRFLPKLLEAIEFQGTEAGQPVIDALHYLKSIEGRRKTVLSQVPLAVINSKSWYRLIFRQEDEIERRAYTFCVLEQLRACLRRRDVFVAPSHRWRDPRAQLLQGEAWKSAKPHVCRLLEHSANPRAELEALKEQLHEAYSQTAANFSQNGAVRIEGVSGSERLVLTGLEKLEESQSLRNLRAEVESLLPVVDLAEVLLEIQARTSFASEFTHISDSKARVKDLEISICAVLLAEACNIGLEPLVRSDVPALTRDRLSWVKQNYVRAETIVKANARLVETQTQLALAQLWGGCEAVSFEASTYQYVGAISVFFSRGFAAGKDASLKLVWESGAERG
jgi:Domain of unknown function (DUF4158)/Tn3 transposase DDE domain